MPDQNFDALSPSDFEDLARDLLSRHLGGQHVESFTAGRDKGVDLRVVGRPGSRDRVIAQCKHYARSGYAKLLRSLKAEKAKVAALKPRRYLVYTTVSMTAARKAEIMQEMHPYVRTAQDVWGAEDIEAQLRDNPDILKAHYKLWMNSTAVMERIVHSGIHTRTESYMADLLHAARLYVQNGSYNFAVQKLNTYGVCAISGPPGVGKTTLANILLLDYVAQGFTPIVLSSDMAEADDVYSTSVKQVFLYDDFLGRTSSLERLGKNEDDRILRFMRRVHQSRDKRLLLTTREYILRQAQLEHERLNDPRIDLARLVVDLTSYSRLDRAKILYNHLYFSDLEAEALRSVLRERRYRSIIQHPNYVPRLVGDSVSLFHASGKAAGDFASYLEATLDKPEQLWAHILERQLHRGAQLLLLFMLCHEEEVTLRRLQELYTSVDADELEPFDDALRSLEGTVVAVNSSSTDATVDFVNPGVQDAVIGRLGQVDRLVALHLQADLDFDELALYWAQVRGATSRRISVLGLSRPRAATNAALRRSKGGEPTAASRCLARRGDAVSRVLAKGIFQESTRHPSVEERIQLLLAVCRDLGVSPVGLDWNEARERVTGGKRRGPLRLYAWVDLAGAIFHHETLLEERDAVNLVGDVIGQVTYLVAPDAYDFGQCAKLIDAADEGHPSWAAKANLLGLMSEGELGEQFERQVDSLIDSVLQEGDPDLASSQLETIEDLLRDFEITRDLQDARTYVDELERPVEPDEDTLLEAREDRWDGSGGGGDPVDDLFSTLDV